MRIKTEGRGNYKTDISSGYYTAILLTPVPTLATPFGNGLSVGKILRI